MEKIEKTLLKKINVKDNVQWTVKLLNRHFREEFAIKIRVINKNFLIQPISHIRIHSKSA